VSVIVGDGNPNILGGDTNPLDLKDQIFGLGGNDILAGGGDADRLSGGTGDDLFFFQAGGPGNHLETDLLDLFTFHYDRILDFGGAGVAGGDVVQIDTATNAGRLQPVTFDFLHSEWVYGVYDAAVLGNFLGYLAVDGPTPLAPAVGDVLFV
jgi:Ca2+-binding RTX toxin-like protein